MPLFFAAMMFGFNGCDVFRDSECSNLLEDKQVERGEAVIRIEGDGECHTLESGSAWFNPQAVDPSNRPTLFMEVRAPGERGVAVFLARRGHGVPEEDVYEIADISNASPPYPGRFETYEDAFSVAGYELKGGPAYATSGTFTITRVEEDFLEGSFSVLALLEEMGEEVQLMGRFRAAASDVPWQSY